jgi:diguanylate cyclase (GGDEF)-like protein
MHTFESVAGRILAPLSELLQKPLHLVDSQSADAGNGFAVRLAEESEGRYRELEHRMMSLQRENLDLIVRNRTLSEVSSRDTLTGLYNRWFVIEKLDSELNRSLRHGSPMSILMLDVDHFKRINDTFGHAVGDQVLQAVGKLLRDSCRVYDVPGRYGGEEFCIVLPETKPGNTSVVAERIRSRLESMELPCGDSTIAVTASIGIAGMDVPADSEVLSPAALLDRADRALYSAKNRGRNRVEMWVSDLLHGVEHATGH